MKVDGRGLVSLIRRGHLRGTRKDGGSWWFEPADVDAAAPFVDEACNSPTTDEPVAVRIAPAQLAEIDRLAGEVGITRSEMIGRLVDRALELQAEM